MWVRYSIAVALFTVIAVFSWRITLDNPSNRSPNIINVGVLPDQDQETLKATFKPLLDHLELKTGLQYNLIIPNDYQKLVSLFEEGGVDLAYFGGLTFVQALHSADALPLVMRGVDLRFSTSFIVRNEPNWKSCQLLSCEELRGEVLAFGSRLSTSGHLMPRHFLKDRFGIAPESFFGEIIYSGTHHKTVFGVQSGQAAVGAVNTSILNAMMSDGRVEKGDLHVIWETPPYADYVWAIQANTSSEIVSSIRNAFLSLNILDDVDRRIFDNLRAKKFIPASKRDFEILTDIAIKSNMIDGS